MEVVTAPKTARKWSTGLDRAQKCLNKALRHLMWLLVLSCAGLRFGLDDPCGTLPAPQSLWFKLISLPLSSPIIAIFWHTQFCSKLFYRLLMGMRLWEMSSNTCLWWGIKITAYTFLQKFHPLNEQNPLQIWACCKFTYNCKYACVNGGRVTQ